MNKEKLTSQFFFVHPNLSKIIIVIIFFGVADKTTHLLKVTGISFSFSFSNIHFVAWYYNYQQQQQTSACKLLLCQNICENVFKNAFV